MTQAIHILRCGYCKKSFSYIPTEEDKCQPGTENQICDDCAELLFNDPALENERKHYDPTDSE